MLSLFISGIYDAINFWIWALGCCIGTVAAILIVFATLFLVVYIYGVIKTICGYKVQPKVVVGTIPPKK